MELPRPCPLLDNSSVPQRRSKYSPFFRKQIFAFFYRTGLQFLSEQLRKQGQINSASIAHP
ncbi:hypothetical protein DPQ22_06170 [Candidatus Tokpelaia sp.]|nr:hypothetical protein DPQ22_06170 [Candidatus Tokpelaia sp.]